MNQKALGKRTLLIVEDDELNREILKAMLEDDFIILEAENGREGLEVLQNNYREISLVVLDVQMPVMNGYEFLKVVKKDTLLSTIPVIVATGSNRSDDEEYTLDLGAADFVTKPYNRHVVQLRIANIIRLRESVSTLSEIEYDDLTGIYTRQAFLHHADRLLFLNPDKDYDLIISDIEDFRSIVTRYGALVADEVIKANAKILTKENRDSGGVYGRYGDNQFVAVYLHNIYHKKPVETFAVDVPTPSGKVHVECRMKFGIKRYINHDIAVRQHCRHAMAALNTVKHKYSKYIAEFDPKMQEYMERRAAIENTMQTALREKQFIPYYQPKHDIITGKLVGAECLIRWTHPSFGFLAPNEFIPIFEQTGFVSEADLYIWEQTCINIRKWQEESITMVPISVNCSRIGFLQDDFLEQWMKPIYDNGISADCLRLEITETLFTDHIEELKSILNNCRSHGIKIELDDFGTGYSSLSMLEQLPLDVVKLDMSFIQGVAENGKNAVMPAIVSLIHNLGMKIIAEGIETESQMKHARQAGIDIAQGYYYSKPLTEEEFLEYLKVYSKDTKA